MLSSICERAIEDARKSKKAILKYISANDVGLTGGHQYGYYLPKDVWYLFSPNEPIRGHNAEHDVEVTWPNDQITHSKVKWYGNLTRSEYRLTRFGRDFPYLTHDNLGDLLVLVPHSLNQFNAYVLDLDEDIEDLQSALGVEIIRSWVAYELGVDQSETENACLNRRFREFAETLDSLPAGTMFSIFTREAVYGCVHDFTNASPDDQLIKLIEEEYNLYKISERKVFQPEVLRLFMSIDDFLGTAMRILQARKSRAGRSLENHIEYLLLQANIPFQMRQNVDDTKPDIIIPNKEAYDNLDYPIEKLFMVGVKRTCKDRWRQVISEAPRIQNKHIFTLQEGISENQLSEMRASNVTLIVPNSLHHLYPRNFRSGILSVQSFLSFLRNALY